MLKKKLIIGYKGKRIKLVAEDCNIWRKFSGLMFSRREKAKILLFAFKKKQNIAIHSFFVFYPFIAVWIDEKNKVVDVKVVKPFTSCVFPKEKSVKLVEIPINKKNKKIVKYFHSDVKTTKKVTSRR
ncbi:putative ACR [uncultured archaeon]|nr:putative ACR [uncultured archaeon]